MKYVRFKPGGWDHAHTELNESVGRSARNEANDPDGIAEVDEAAAEQLIAKGLADEIDASFPAVRVSQPAIAFVPGRDLSNNRILRVIEDDVPEPLSGHATEAERMLEHVTTHRTLLSDMPEEEFRAWMRTQPEIAHLADAELPEPVPFIGRWAALGLIKQGLAEPVLPAGP